MAGPSSLADGRSALDLFRGIRSEDADLRIQGIEELLLRLQDIGEEDLKKLREYLPTIVMLAHECPHEDVRGAMEEFLGYAAELGLESPRYCAGVSWHFAVRRDRVATGVTDALEVATMTADGSEEGAEERARALLRGLVLSEFRREGRVPAMLTALSMHPDYLGKSLATERALFTEPGSLPPAWRHFLGLMAASRVGSRTQWVTHWHGYLSSGGSPSWLMPGGDVGSGSGDEGEGEDASGARRKLLALGTLNAKLEHRPWSIGPEDISSLTESEGGSSWSITQLVHAVLVLTTAQANAHLALALGVLPDPDLSPGPLSEGVCAPPTMAFSKPLPEEGLLEEDPDAFPPSPDMAPAEEAGGGAAEGDDEELVQMRLMGTADGATGDDGDAGTRVLRDKKDVDAAWAERRGLGTFTDEERNSVWPDRLTSGWLPFSVPPSSTAGPAAGTSTPPRSPTPARASSPPESSSDRAVSPGASGDVAGATPSSSEGGGAAPSSLPASAPLPATPQAGATFGDLLDTLAGPYPRDYTYKDFMDVRLSPLKTSDFSWEGHGHVLLSHFFPSIAPLLDDEFEAIYRLTYHTFGATEKVDTEPFRRSLWYYSMRLLGVESVEFNYRAVNNFITIATKLYCKQVVCFPATLTAAAFATFSRRLTVAEKVHATLLCVTARKLATLLHALRAIAAHYNRT